MSTRQVWVEVDISGHNETFVVVIHIVGECQQVINVSDLVRVGGTARAAGVFGYTGRGQGKNQEC
ncbi:MAG: hypothetical protein ABII09_04265 [Planctomycetota bacterium]